jgi:hypothetical protein
MNSNKTYCTTILTHRVENSKGAGPVSANAICFATDHLRYSPLRDGVGNLVVSDPAASVADRGKLPFVHASVPRKVCLAIADIRVVQVAGRW